MSREDRANETDRTPTFLADGEGFDAMVRHAAERDVPAPRSARRAELRFDLAERHRSRSRGATAERTSLARRRRTSRKVAP